MAKPWKEVIASPQYQQLPPDQQAAAQEQYFNEVVAPKAGDQAAAARQQFFAAYPSAVAAQAKQAPARQPSATGVHTSKQGGVMKVTANGKTFTFPQGTSTDDIGSAIDEYFAGQAQPQQQQPMNAYAQGMVDTNAALAQSREDDATAAKGFRERAVDAITGSSQMTPELEGLQNIGSAPELNELSMNAFKAGIGQLFGSDASQMQILQNMGGKLSQDSKGNVVVSLPSGDYALNKPGLSPQDVTSFLANALAFTPAGRGASILAATGKSAATDVALQGAVQAAGGESIDPLQTVLSAGIGGAGKAAEKGVSALTRATRGTMEPEKQAAVDFAQQNNLPLMTSDVFQKKTLPQQWASTVGERVPFFGTGKNRLTQQEAREGLVKTFSDEVGGISDDALYRSASTGQQKFIKAAGQRYDRVINAMGDTPVDISGTVKTIDDQIAKLTKPGRSQDRAAISVLKQYKDDITGGVNDLRLARDNRTDLRKRFMAAPDEVDRDVLEKALEPIYKAYTLDMAKAVSKKLGPEEASNLYRADRSWAKFNDMMGNTRVQKAIESGKVNPEDVTKLIFSQKAADRSQLFRLLDDKGRQNARAALVQNAVNKATNPSGEISVEKFISDMHRNRKQAGTFFRGEHGKRFDGVIKYLDSTRHASKANFQALNGQQLYGLLVGGGLASTAAMAGLMKTAAAVVPTMAVAGGIGKGYESRIMRNALLRLANTPKGSTAYDRAISRVSEAITPIIQASAQGETR
ncbi:putative prophage DNA transfer protein [Enterobacterales bacterium 8AC]|nr:putative prophage DNA transfer protein [Enterobacterales bacterium 8AC]